MSDNLSETGAVRSADADHLDFASLPWVGIIGVARTAYEGGQKYGRHNYVQGMTVHSLLNHAMRHHALYLLGDRSEPHLEHAAWGALVAIQSAVLDPELNAPHLLGPGATVPAAMRELLARDAPILAEKRKKGVFSRLADWAIGRLPEIDLVIRARGSVVSPKSHVFIDPDSAADLKQQLMKAMEENARKREAFACKKSEDSGK